MVLQPRFILPQLPLHVMPIDVMEIAFGQNRELDPPAVQVGSPHRTVVFRARGPGELRGSEGEAVTIEPFPVLGVGSGYLGLYNRVLRTTSVGDIVVSIAQSPYEALFLECLASLGNALPLEFEEMCDLRLGKRMAGVAGIDQKCVYLPLPERCRGVIHSTTCPY